MNPLFQLLNEYFFAYMDKRAKRLIGTWLEGVRFGSFNAFLISFFNIAKIMCGKISHIQMGAIILDLLKKSLGLWQSRIAYV